MSNRNRDGSYLTVIYGTLLAVFLALIVGVFTYSRAWNAAYEYHERSSYNYDIGQSQRQGCRQRATVEEALDCLENAEAASRDNHRAEQNLNAQRQMADWAFYMLIATVALGSLTFAAAVAAAVYAGISAKAARQTVGVTREIGEAQTRAYLVAEEAEYFVTKNLIQVVVSIRNTGNSPAKNITMNGELRYIATVVESGLPDQIHRFRLWFNHMPVPGVAGGSVGKGVIFISRLDPGIDAAQFDGVVANQEDLSLFCHVSWQDVFGKPTKEDFLFGTDVTLSDPAWGGTKTYERRLQGYQSSIGGPRPNRPQRGSG